MKDIIEIEDIIPVDYQNHLLETLTGWDFPWVLNKNIVSGDACFRDLKSNPPGFNHFFYEQNAPTSNFFQLVYPLVLSITSKANVPFNRLYRMRANLTLANGPENVEHLMPHIDSFHPHWNAIYYVNDSDGDTLIFNETNDTFDSGQADIDRIKADNFTVKHRVKPKKGKLLAFDGRYYHTASFCKESNYRCLININLGNIMI
jgi:hypothetical protein